MRRGKSAGSAARRLVPKRERLSGSGCLPAPRFAGGAVSGG